MAASYIEALIPPEGTETTNYRWSGVLGSGASVTFSFRATVQPGAADGDGFQQFTAAQQAAAQAVLELYEEVCDISFTGINAGGYSDDGQILFANNTQGSAGYAYFPSQYPDGAGGTTFHPLSGDVWINNAISANKQELDPGESGFHTLLHEVGHALGLKHPFAADADHGILPDATESSQYTAMSYTGHPHGKFRYTTDEGEGRYSFSFPFIEPSTPMLYDIAALQYLYGANQATRAGNDTYMFDPDAPFLQCIWDAGGKDTISVANFTEDCRINLNAGKFSSITILPEALPDGYTGGGILPTYDGTDNLSIAFGVRIENATGGSGRDTLTGNKFANLLKGNAGNDVLNGGGGNDNLNGGGGKDNLNGGTGKDKLLGGAGNDVLIWQASDTKVDGGGGNDTLKVTRGKLDLTAISDPKILNIETIDMTGGKASVLTLNVTDVLAISRTDVLKVLGSSNDDVTIRGDWDSAEGPTGFVAYTSGAATLLVDLDVGVTLVA